MEECLEGKEEGGRPGRRGNGKQGRQRPRGRRAAEQGPKEAQGRRRMPGCDMGSKGKKAKTAFSGASEEERGRSDGRTDTGGEGAGEGGQDCGGGRPENSA